MDKKWYNYFVTIESTENQQPPMKAERKPDEPGRAAAQTVAEIAASVNREVKFTAPVEDPTSFNEIYAAAAIQPAAHGYTILKIADMLDSELIRSLPPEVKRRSILVALEAASVKITDIVEDAVKRDRALDTFERVQQKAVTELENKKTQENRKLQEEIDKLVAEKQARIQANSGEVAHAKERFKSWCARKQQEEKRIFDAVSPFVSENPITISGGADTGPAAKTEKP
jgi:hypothetical protein